MAIRKAGFTSSPKYHAIVSLLLKRLSYYAHGVSDAARRRYWKPFEAKSHDLKDMCDAAGYLYITGVAGRMNLKMKNRAHEFDQRHQHPRGTG